MNTAERIESAVTRTGRDRKRVVAQLETLAKRVVTDAFGEDREYEIAFQDGDDLRMWVIVEVTDKAPLTRRDVRLSDVAAAGIKASVGNELMFEIFWRREDELRAREQDRLYGDLIGVRDTIAKIGAQVEATISSL